MKYRTLTVCLAVVVLGLAGCGAAAEKPQTGVPNPMHSYENKTALEEAVGFAPLDIGPNAGYTAQTYYSIGGTLAQSLLADAAGNELTLRAAKGDADISGVWGVKYEQKTLKVGGAEREVSIGSLKEAKKETFVLWFTADGMAYSASAFGPELTLEAFEALLPELVW